MSPSATHPSPGTVAVEADVAVIGTGPAGSALATYLAREGKQVIVFEREQFPRFSNTYVFEK